MTAPPPNPMADQPVRLIGESEAMNRLRDLVRHVGPTDAGVVVTGPSAAAAASSPPRSTPLRHRPARRW
ncbi:hypothetical protein AB5I41_07410 [Sphingomonas sp. MMS24-JH45]